MSGPGILDVVISVEHRAVPGRARSGGTWQRQWSRARRAVATHVYVCCDGQLAELVTCPRRLLTSASDAEGARAEAVEQGWEFRAEGTVRDLCPRHAVSGESADAGRGR